MKGETLLFFNPLESLYFSVNFEKKSFSPQIALTL